MTSPDAPARPTYRKWVIVLCIAAGALLGLTSINMGFIVDDYFHIAILEKLLPFGTPSNLFDFMPGDAEVLNQRMLKGPFPWYTLPEAKARFFRPIASASICLDHALFGRNPIPQHLHSVLWYIVLMSGAAWLLTRVLPAPVGWLALLIFCVDASHWFPVAWLANRNALMATSFALWGFCAHIRWREEGWKPGLPLSLAGYALGLSAGESALGILAFVPAYALFREPGRFQKKFMGFLPAALLVMAYLLMYKHFNYGAYGSGTYIDPIQEPLHYLACAPGRILALLGGRFLAYPIDLNIFLPWVKATQAWAGAGAALIFGAALRAAWPHLAEEERRALRWMLPGAGFALLPVVATFPTSRLLLSASLGFCVLLACLLRHIWSTRRIGLSRWGMFFVAGLIILINFVASPIAWPVQSAFLRYNEQNIEKTLMSSEIDDMGPAPKRLVVLAAPDPMTAIYPPIIRAVLHHQPVDFVQAWIVLSQAPYPHRITRTAQNRIEVEVVGGSLLSTEFEMLFRSPTFPFTIGQTFPLDGGLVTILALGTTGPSRFAVDFTVDADDPSWSFLIWKDGLLRKTSLPAVGESVVIPHEGGLV